MPFAIIDTVTKKVVNVVEYDAAPTNPPPGFGDGYIAVEAERVDVTWAWDGKQLVAPPPAPPPIGFAAPSFLARDFFSLLTPDDFTAIVSATSKSPALGLLWASLQAQGEAPVRSNADRFLAGWAGLKQALGPTRSAAIATALKIPDA